MLLTKLRLPVLMNLLVLLVTTLPSLAFDLQPPSPGSEVSQKTLRLSFDPPLKLAKTLNTDSRFLEQAVLEELNRARTNPAAYADELEDLKQYYNDRILSLPEEDRIRTREGVEALNEAIAFLRELEPLPLLNLSSGMSQAAQDHLQDLGESGGQGNIGSDGSKPGDRLKRYGAWSGEAIELASYGKNTALAIVTLLMVNDGNPNRSLRAEIFNPNYQFVGIACGFHATQRSWCVLNYATQYTEANQALASQPAISSQPTAIIDQNNASSARVKSNATQPDLSSHSEISSVSITYLSALEQEIIAETNRVRQNPTAYAAELENLRQYYDGKLLRLPGVAPLETEEGVAVLDEAIAALRNTKPLSPLTPSRGMSLGARDHVRDLGSTGKVGHYGSDGSDPFTRINRYGTWQTVAGENISYSPLNTAEWHVMQLIIDDGVPDRGHRKAILKPDFRVTGVACDSHVAYGNVCDMTYAGGYLENP